MLATTAVISSGCVAVYAKRERQILVLDGITSEPIAGAKVLTRPQPFIGMLNSPARGEYVTDEHGKITARVPIYWMSYGVEQNPDLGIPPGALWAVSRDQLRAADDTNITFGPDENLYGDTTPILIIGPPADG